MATITSSVCEPIGASICKTLRATIKQPDVFSYTLSYTLSYTVSNCDAVSEI
jgi:hypothetical protein